jgi:hypothetical protein
MVQIPESAERIRQMHEPLHRLEWRYGLQITSGTGNGGDSMVEAACLPAFFRWRSYVIYNVYDIPRVCYNGKKGFERNIING